MEFGKNISHILSPLRIFFRFGCCRFCIAFNNTHRHTQLGDIYEIRGWHAVKRTVKHAHIVRSKEQQSNGVELTFKKRMPANVIKRCLIYEL